MFYTCEKNVIEKIEMKMTLVFRGTSFYVITLKRIIGKVLNYVVVKFLCS